MLCSVRSRYLFAIGLGECLAFAVDARGVREGYPTPSTLGLTRPVLRLLTGLSPCVALRSRRLQKTGRGVSVSPNSTFPVRDSVWAVSRLLAVTDDIAVLLSVPAPTEMFQFGAFPIALWQLRWGFPFGDPQFFVSMRLPEAYRSLARPSSASEPSYPPVGIVAIRYGRYEPELTASSPVSVWIARTYGVITLAVVCSEAFNPSHLRSHEVVHRSSSDQLLPPLPT